MCTTVSCSRWWWMWVKWQGCPANEGLNPWNAFIPNLHDSQCTCIRVLLHMPRTYQLCPPKVLESVLLQTETWQAHAQESAQEQELVPLGSIGLKYTVTQLSGAVEQSSFFNMQDNEKERSIHAERILPPNV